MAKLVTIGDSLTQGFQSGSICKTHLSYPALIAQAMGLNVGTQFRVPEFGGPKYSFEVGVTPKFEYGLPLNIEDIARIWDTFPWLESLPNPFKYGEIYLYLRAVKHYWEEGGGTQPATSGPIHHNLAVWGFEVGDANTLSQGLCFREIARGLEDSEIMPITSYPMYRTAQRTLNPCLSHSNSDLTQIKAAQEIALNDGGIEHLIYFLGANNCLGAITHLGNKVRFSQEADLYLLSHDRTATVWTPELFYTLYSRVADEVEAIGASHVYIGTVPHMHIAPIAHGSGGPSQPATRDKDGLYPYYIPCWVSSDKFEQHPDKYPAFFTRDNMRMINHVIDNYNIAIRELIDERKRKGLDWHLVDTCDLLDQLYADTYKFPADLVAALNANNATKDRFVGDKPIITTDFFIYNQKASSKHEKYKGGFFGLDGVHPTTVGYGLLAWAFVDAMTGGNPSSILNLDWWKNVVNSDTLLTNPPRSMQAILDKVGQFSSANIFQLIADIITGETRLTR